MPSLLAVDEFGTGKPLVLVHGIATERSIWDLVVHELARTRRVVALAVPGFGDSVPAGEDFILHEVADRIVAGLAGAGVTGPFDLVGHSLGGGIAIVLAATHQQLVRRLVLDLQPTCSQCRYGARGKTQRGAADRHLGGAGYCWR